MIDLIFSSFFQSIALSSQRLVDLGIAHMYEAPQSGVVIALAVWLYRKSKPLQLMLASGIVLVGGPWVYQEASVFYTKTEEVVVVKIKQGSQKLVEVKEIATENLQQVNELLVEKFSEIGEEMCEQIEGLREDFLGQQESTATQYFKYFSKKVFKYIIVPIAIWWLFCFFFSFAAALSGDRGHGGDVAFEAESMAEMSALEPIEQPMDEMEISNISDAAVSAPPAIGWKQPNIVGIAKKEGITPARPLNLLALTWGIPKEARPRFVVGVQTLQLAIRKGEYPPEALRAFLGRKGKMVLPGESFGGAGDIGSLEDHLGEIERKRQQLAQIACDASQKRQKAEEQRVKRELAEEECLRQEAAADAHSSAKKREQKCQKEEEQRVKREIAEEERLRQEAAVDACNSAKQREQKREDRLAEEKERMCNEALDMAHAASRKHTNAEKIQEEIDEEQKRLKEEKRLAKKQDNRRKRKEAKDREHLQQQRLAEAREREAKKQQLISSQGSRSYYPSPNGGLRRKINSVSSHGGRGGASRGGNNEDPYLGNKDDKNYPNNNLGLETLSGSFSGLVKGTFEVSEQAVRAAVENSEAVAQAAEKLSLAQQSLYLAKEGQRPIEAFGQIFGEKISVISDSTCPNAFAETAQGVVAEAETGASAAQESYKRTVAEGVKEGVAKEGLACTVKNAAVRFGGGIALSATVDYGLSAGKTIYRASQGKNDAFNASRARCARRIWRKESYANLKNTKDQMGTLGREVFKDLPPAKKVLTNGAGSTTGAVIFGGIGSLIGPWGTFGGSVLGGVAGRWVSEKFILS